MCQVIALKYQKFLTSNRGVVSEEDSVVLSLGVCLGS